MDLTGDWVWNYPATKPSSSQSIIKHLRTFQLSTKKERKKERKKRKNNLTVGSTILYLAHYSKRLDLKKRNHNKYLT